MKDSKTIKQIKELRTNGHTIRSIQVKLKISSPSGVYYYLKNGPYLDKSYADLKKENYNLLKILKKKCSELKYLKMEIMEIKYTFDKLLK